MSARDPFQLIDDPVLVLPAQLAPATPLVVMPLELEAVMDETIQVLCEKLAAAEEAAAWGAKDTLRLLWLGHRLGGLDYRSSDNIFGNSDWTDIRDAVDAAMEKGW